MFIVDYIVLNFATKFYFFRSKKYKSAIVLLTELTCLAITVCLLSKTFENQVEASTYQIENFTYTSDNASKISENTKSTLSFKKQIIIEL